MIKFKTLSTLVSLPALLLLASCAGAEPPPSHALDVTCDTGGRHGPSGVMDWTCIDGDGERRLPVRSLHEIIEGAPDDDDG
ncbi:hypothetical protein NHF40_02750 [Maricaulaceae bacterium EIL42A08]|nr:hypothetical protein [Maricaulaceae bacterium EIL42A08]MCP2680570.1 hypothetical protein [Maricaulaceae bacterium NA33B04]